MDSYVSYVGICEFDIYENGEYVKTIEKQNVLTLGGQHCVLNALRSNRVNCFLNRAVVGRGVVAKNITNTLGTFLTPTFCNIQFFSTTSTIASDQLLKVKWDLPITQYNGYTITEIGLTFRDANNQELLFSRVTLTATESTYKTPAIAVTGMWKITVTESPAAP